MGKHFDFPRQGSVYIMETSDLIQALESLPNRNFKLDNDQRAVVSHGNGPLWVIAGPGSGKTDSIVFRCLKLLVVDRVPPASIILTTFTEKAANNLQTRISQYMGLQKHKVLGLKEASDGIIMAFWSNKIAEELK